MIETQINKKNLELFLSNIRKCDKEELQYFLGDNFEEKFIDTVLNNQNTTYLLSYNSIPSCIGGYCKDNIGLQIWLLCANKFDKKYLFKYLKSKIAEFKKIDNVLYNFIYKSNFSAIKWLKKFGFKFVNTENPDLKLFYFKGDNLDIRYFTNKFLYRK